MDIEQFKKRFKEDNEFHEEVRTLVEEIGGLNLWDGQNMTMFHDLWQDNQ